MLYPAELRGQDDAANKVTAMIAAPLEVCIVARSQGRASLVRGDDVERAPTVTAARSPRNV